MAASPYRWMLKNTTSGQYELAAVAGLGINPTYDVQAGFGGANAGPAMRSDTVPLATVLKGISAFVSATAGQDDGGDLLLEGGDPAGLATTADDDIPGAVKVANGYRFKQSVQAVTLTGDADLLWGYADTGDVTITANLIVFDPGGADRTIDLPPEAASDGVVLHLQNTNGSQEILTVRDDAGNTLGTIGDGGQASYYCDGTTWFSLTRAGSTAAAQSLTGNGQTITHNGARFKLVSATGAHTGAILEAGYYDGQVFTMFKSASQVWSFDATEATSNVFNTDVLEITPTGVLPITFIWSAITQLWYHDATFTS